MENVVGTFVNLQIGKDRRSGPQEGTGVGGGGVWGAAQPGVQAHPPAPRAPFYMLSLPSDQVVVQIHLNVPSCSSTPFLKSTHTLP